MQYDNVEHVSIDSNRFINFNFSGGETYNAAHLSSTNYSFGRDIQSRRRTQANQTFCLQGAGHSPVSLLRPALAASGLNDARPGGAIRSLHLR